MTLPEETTTSSLTQKTVKGVFWSYVSFLGGKVLNFLTTIILARLLLPEQFGLIGYCLIVIQYVDIINSAGIDTALIARRDKVQEAANAAFVANMIFGVTSFAITWVIAGPVSVFFKAPQIVPLFRVLGLTLPLSGLGMVPDTMLRREMKFQTVLISEVTRNFMKGFVSVLMALWGFGVWSLVWGQVIGVATGSLLSWILAGWRPTWRYNREVARTIVFFGFHIILLETAGAIRTNVDYILVGRILGAAALGYYTMSYRIPELLIRSLNYVIGNVSLPALAMTSSDKPRMQKFYFGYIRFISMFVFPLGVGLAFTSPVFIPLFLSEKWGPAIVPTALISIALAIAALGFVPGVLYKAISRPDILNKLALAKMPIAVAILWYATRWNIVGVAAAQIVIGIISIIMDMLVVNYVMKYPLRDLVKAIAPSFTATMAMAVTLFAVRRVWPQADILQLILMVVLGGATFVLVMWWMDKDSLLQGLMTLRSTLNRRKATKAWASIPHYNGERVSAIITAYNSEAYIAEAITSILKQSRVVDEIVVVDDGSTDNTRRIVAEFAEQGIKFIHQNNRGAGAARNKGIGETSGEFIAFLDADDIWLENKTELQLNYLLEHPQVALVGGFARWWNVIKNTVRISGKAPNDMKTLRREILVHNVLGNPSMVMVRRSALAEVGLFNESVRWGQDWELWQRLVQRFDAAVIPQPLTVYRWHQDNLSHERGWARLVSYWNVSRNAIRKSQPAWRRPLLMARSWSNFTYRRAMYAIQSAFPRWKRVAYALAALLVYPFEMTREKLGALVRSLLGDRIYRGGKRVLGAGMQTRGPE